MEIVDGSWLTTEQRRAVVEAGNTVFYPFGADEYTLEVNAGDIMEGSYMGYEYKLIPSESGGMHRAEVIPTGKKTERNPAVLPRRRPVPVIPPFAN